MCPIRLWERYDHCVETMKDTVVLVGTDSIGQASAAITG